MPRLELQIDVEDGEEHVYGIVRTEGGVDHSFVGWIGLLSLLQQAVS
jgi:hypothetical protein